MYNFKLVNADTDSIMICAPEQEFIEKNDRIELLKELNSIMPPNIIWADDGYFSSVVVLKAKNYVLKDEKGKVKIKGSALRSSKTEKALKEFMGKVIDCLLDDKEEDIIAVYNSYVKEIYNLKDINRWGAKKTITDKVLNAERTNEQKVLDALEGTSVQMGDKVYMYFKEDDSLSRCDNWDAKQPNHNKNKLCEKLYKTLKIFENVLDISKYPNYKLKRNKTLLKEVLENVH